MLVIKNKSQLQTGNKWDDNYLKLQLIALYLLGIRDSSEIDAA